MAKTLEMSRQLSDVSSKILLNICRDKVSIVVTFVLPITFSFVAIILKLSRHYKLHGLAKSVVFLALFTSFSFINLGDDPIILH